MALEFGLLVEHMGSDGEGGERDRSRRFWRKLMSDALRLRLDCPRHCVRADMLTCVRARPGRRSHGENWAKTLEGSDVGMSVAERGLASDEGWHDALSIE